MKWVIVYLAHTHDTSCYELVDGSNCANCGDLVCDTPADPNLIRDGSWVDLNCNYVGTVTDANGDPYNPDPHNFMSYARHVCRDSFTPGQVQRMHTALQTLSFLIPVTAAPEVQGPKFVCTNGTFTQTSPPNNSMISWTVTPSDIVTPSSGTGSIANLTKISNSSAVITFVNGCYQLPSYYFWVGKPKVLDYQGNPSTITIQGNTSFARSPFPCIENSFTAYDYTYYVGIAETDYTKIKGMNGNVAWSGSYGGSSPAYHPRGIYFSPNSLIGPMHGSGYFSATATNGCGSTVVASRGYGPCSPFGFAVYPNPASSEISNCQIAG